MNLEKKMRSLLNQNNFTKLEVLFNEVSFEKFSENLIKITFDIESLIPYTFICMLLIKNETSNLHCLASEILAMPLCFIEGAYNSAFQHAKKAIKLEPKDFTLKEYLLFFNKIPEKLVNDKEAKKIALEIIKYDPDNKTANKILNIKKTLNKA